jgi:hypothetical protein
MNRNESGNKLEIKISGNVSSINIRLSKNSNITIKNNISGINVETTTNQETSNIPNKIPSEVVMQNVNNSLIESNNKFNESNNVKKIKSETNIIKNTSLETKVNKSENNFIPFENRDSRLSKKY